MQQIGENQSTKQGLTNQQKKITQKCESYFKELFKTEGSGGWENVLQDVPKLVLETVNSELTKSVTEEEVHEAPFQLGGSMAPTPDCFFRIILSEVLEHPRPRRPNHGHNVSQIRYFAPDP